MPEKPTYEALEKIIQELEKTACARQETESGIKYHLAFEQLIAEISSELAGARNEDIDSVIIVNRHSKLTHYRHPILTHLF